MATRLAAQTRATWLLDRERTRIARDIHDELGAGITQPILEGEVARTAGNGLAHLGDRLREIDGSTRIVTAPNAGCRIALEVPWPP